MRPGGSDPPVPPEDRAGTGGLWRNGGYLRYRLARTISLLGGLISEIACPLLVLRIGGGAAQAGAVASCGLITMAVCQLPGGQLADRFDRRTLMILTDVLRCAALGSVPLAATWNSLTYPQLVAVAMIDGAAAATFQPAASGLLRDLVPGERISQALGHAQGLGAVASFAGPLLGGLLFEVRPSLPFTADAVSFAVSAVLLARAPAGHRERASASADRRITAGIRWLLAQRFTLRLLIFAAVANLAGAATAVMVVIVLRERGTAPAVIGLVMTSIGLGAVAGAPLARRISAWLGPVRVCAAVGGTWSAGFVALSVSSSPWVAGPVLALPFFLAPAIGLTLGTTIYRSAPRELLGRIRTAERLISAGLATTGPLLAGVALQFLGLPGVWLVLGGAVALATVAVAVPRPRRSMPDHPGQRSEAALTVPGSQG